MPPLKKSVEQPSKSDRDRLVRAINQQLKAVGRGFDDSTLASSARAWQQGQS